MKIEGTEYSNQKLTNFFLNDDNYCTLDDGASLITGRAFLEFDDFKQVLTVRYQSLEFFGSIEEQPSSIKIAKALKPKLREILKASTQYMGIDVHAIHLYSAYSLITESRYHPDKLRFPIYGFVHAYYLDHHRALDLLGTPRDQLYEFSLLRVFPPREEVDLEELKRGIDQVLKDWTKPPEWLKSFPFTPLKKDRLEPPAYIDEAPIGDYEAIEAIDLSDLERAKQEEAEATEGQLKPIASNLKEQTAPLLVFPNGVSVDLIMRCLDQKSPDYLGNLDVVIRLIDKRHKGEFETLKAKRLGVRHQIKCARAFEELIQNELGLNGTTAEIRGDSCRRVAFPADWIPDK